MTSKKIVFPELGKRVVTAFVGGALFLGLLVKGDLLGARIIGLVLALGLAYEFASMTLTLPDKKMKMAFLFILILGTHLSFHFVSSFLIAIVFICLFTFFLLTLNLHQKNSAMQTHMQELVYLFFGFVYAGYFTLFLPGLREEGGLHLTLLLFIIVWSSDIGAYFIGVRFGKHKLYAQVSPKKSWEGAFGGLALSFLTAWSYVRFSSLELAPVFLISIVFFINVVSQVGDFCESFLKRALNKKDSSQLLPGHGGFLDRFDGVIFSLPIMYLCVSLLR